MISNKEKVILDIVKPWRMELVDKLFNDKKKPIPNVNRPPNM